MDEERPICDGSRQDAHTRTPPSIHCTSTESITRARRSSGGLTPAEAPRGKSMSSQETRVPREADVWATIADQQEAIERLIEWQNEALREFADLRERLDSVAAELRQAER